METPTLTECPNCNAKLTTGILSSNKLVNKKFGALIREFTTLQHEDFCEKCAQAPFEQAKAKCSKEIAALNVEVSNLLKNVQVVSIPAPLHWDYSVLDMVTAQSTTGTGVFAEFKSSITDFFGMQSQTYNTKISNGEKLCLAQLRLKCLAAGGNAVIGTDIDYAEVGGAQGMLMVCMTGTAVKVNNLEQLGEDRAANLERLAAMMKRREHLVEIHLPNVSFVSAGVV
ncbi:uncharacterized protein YbjQ (UPF0145 family) [Pontibacter ummariensis]|uniref:Uncharacterized conserved protein YbjQ, UPF0145 family n=1 Tax=Pontibacter ummariensis TaxID=1610492 RepID=A0A239HM54_9BACT|nr:heavy metal-binding domain-containing protein [Pontibacter ummariensis]PRY10324.1 uncharacterized protein YbjQ (UPF0145 family) [Pontibacter ummariensis]SNS82245.1 Uncharacterized conserved protein YbjQ, UPF0145 family [Pontibacter ummariensis]